MKKTVTCLAMIVSATAVAKPETKPVEPREPAAAKLQGYTFAACQPRRNLYTGDQAYQNECPVALKQVEVNGGGMMPMKVKVAGCDADHHLIVSSSPISFRCLPPGAVEL